MSSGLAKIHRLVQLSRSVHLPASVRIVEVGPRDGLQNESKILPTNLKIELIDRLSSCNLRTIESSSFVSPKWIPQMADSREVMQRIRRSPGVQYVALAPNLKGYISARDSAVTEVAVFAAASESFSRRNINCSIAESLERFRPILAEAYRDKIKVRGYVSCVLGCPYDGKIDPLVVRGVAKRMKDMGCYEISLGDTIGVGTVESTEAMLNEVLKDVEAKYLAVHFHDTEGRALENILKALEMGISVVDSSIASLGGCPYAQGATGNVSTEDVAYMLKEMGVETQVDLQKLCRTAAWICDVLQRENRSLYRGEAVED